MTEQRIHKINDWTDVDEFIGSMNYIHKHERDLTIFERRKFLALITAIEDYTGDDLTCYHELA